MLVLHASHVVSKKSAVHDIYHKVNHLFKKINTLPWKNTTPAAAAFVILGDNAGNAESILDHVKRRQWEQCQSYEDRLEDQSVLKTIFYPVFEEGRPDRDLLLSSIHSKGGFV